MNKQPETKPCFIALKDDSYKKYVVLCSCLEPAEGTETYKYNNMEPCYILLEKDSNKEPEFCPVCGKSGVNLACGGRVMSILSPCLEL